MTSRIHAGPARIFAVLAGMLLLLAACGDDSNVVARGDALSEADFVAAYASTCVAIGEEINALEADNLEEAKEAAAEAETIVENGVGELRALVPPEDIADDVTTGTDALAGIADIFGDLTGAGSEDEFSEKAAEIDEAQAEAEAALGPLGIDCEFDGADDSGSDDTTESDDSDDSDGSVGSGDSGDTGATGDVPDPDPASSIADYGSDSDLDALADACEGGDFGACDDLFLQSPSDSSYEEYGDSCGGRNEPSGFCATIYG